MRTFFQSNDIKTTISGTLQNPYSYGGVNNQRYAMHSAFCDALGAGIAADAFAFAGIFYGDLGSTAYTGSSGSGSIFKGDHYNQIYPYAMPGYPTVSESCLTAAKNIRCYAEFPWVFKDGMRLLFEGGVFTSDAVIDQCAGISAAPYCQPNYTDEWIQNLLFTDYTQPSMPTSIVAFEPLTNYNVAGTPACGQILYGLTGTPSSNCGVFASTPAFGGCGRMDVDEASGLVACTDQDDRNEPATGLAVPYNRTMVIPFAGALFNPALQAIGGIVATGGIGFAP